MIRKTLFLFLLFLGFGLSVAAEDSERVNHQAVRVVKELTPHWTGTWATAMQTPVKAFMPYNNQMSNRSVRQIVKVSAGGDVVRLQLSNIFSTTPVVLRSVYIAPALGGHRVDSAKAVYLSFSGHRGVTVPAGKSLFSDAVRFALKPLQLVAITVNYQTAPKMPTVHMGSRTTSYILKGESKPSTDFSHAFRYEKWFNIAALDVYTRDVRTIAILGNSITDGKGSTTDHQNRWPDEMSYQLNEVAGAKAVKEGKKRMQYGVLNLGIGNNRVLTVGFGQPARQRFDRDILEQRGVTDVILFEGINDLGNSKDGIVTAHELVEAYKQMIEKCHKAGLKVWLGTITPMKGAHYYSVSHELGRKLVNNWIRLQHEADGVLDFDKLMRDPADEHALRPGLYLPDHLHPNAEGYKMMGKYAAERMLTLE